MFSESCERNKGPIAEILKVYIESRPFKMMELGSYSGQHALHFLSQFDNLYWYLCDQKDYQNHLCSLKHDRILGLFDYTVGREPWPQWDFEGLFTANTLHIMSQEDVDCFLDEVLEKFPEQAFFFIYGPFKFNGKYTSDSNKAFDQWLKNRDPKSGIRNFEDIESKFIKNDIELLNVHDMPANNNLLVFKSKRLQNS